ncbi:MAG: hypothetical protein MZV70_33730 [Desulfobacterales bacterium]|nr:hypothetical protein [Desulfobacterales bacterium]
MRAFEITPESLISAGDDSTVARALGDRAERLAGPLVERYLIVAEVLDGRGRRPDPGCSCLLRRLRGRHRPLGARRFAAHQHPRVPVHRPDCVEPRASTPCWPSAGCGAHHAAVRRRRRSGQLGRRGSSSVASNRCCASTRHGCTRCSAEAIGALRRGLGARSAARSSRSTRAAGCTSRRRPWRSGLIVGPVPARRGAALRGRLGEHLPRAGTGAGDAAACCSVRRPVGRACRCRDARPSRAACAGRLLAAVATRRRGSTSSRCSLRAVRRACRGCCWQALATLRAGAPRPCRRRCRSELAPYAAERAAQQRPACAAPASRASRPTPTSRRRPRCAGSSAGCRARRSATSCRSSGRTALHYGEEDMAGIGVRIGAHRVADLHVVLMSLAATPEAENHGVVIAAARDAAHRRGRRPRCASSSTSRRTPRGSAGDASLAPRLEERRRLWRELRRRLRARGRTSLAETGLQALHWGESVNVPSPFR